MLSGRRQDLLAVPRNLRASSIDTRLGLSPRYLAKQLTLPPSSLYDFGLGQFGPALLRPRLQNALTLAGFQLQSSAQEVHRLAGAQEFVSFVEAKRPNALQG